MSREKPRVLLAAAVRDETAPLRGLGWLSLPPDQVDRWPLQRWSVAGAEVVAVATGVGMEACREAIIAIDARRRVDGLICLGLAGAARAGLEVGAICVSERVITNDLPKPETLEPHPAIRDLVCGLARGNGWCVGTGLCSPLVIPDPAGKAAVAAENGCDWIDMESGGAARMGQRLAVPWIVIRAIGDTVADDLNGSFGALRNERGQVQWFEAAGKFARSPRTLPTALRLRRQDRRATIALSKALGSLVPAFIDELKRAWV